MRMRSRHRNLIVGSPSGGQVDGYGAPRFTRLARPMRIRWWLRTGALLAVMGITWLARTMRARWRLMFVVTGALLLLVGVMASSAAAFVPGLLVLLFALLKGAGACDCRAAAQLTQVRWRG